MTSRKYQRLERILSSMKTGDGPEMSALDGLEDPFEVLVTIVLGLKVSDAQVIKVRDKLFRVPKVLVVDGMRGDVHKIIEPLGMAKSRFLSIISIQDYFRYKVPTTFGELKQIHGVGPKAAALYLDVVFGRPTVCIDTHCHRVLERIGYVGDARTQQLDLMTDLPKERWNEVNPKLIAHGQSICRPNPDCFHCFLDCKIS